MLTKTRAIILHYIKYGESSVIAYCYTQHFGRVSLIVQGVRKKKSRVKLNLLQPLQANEIDFYHKEKAGLMRLKEIRSCHQADGLLFDARRNAVALFLSEVLYKTLKEEVKNEEQYAFIEEKIGLLGRLENGFPAFYLKFMLDYTQFLGFSPNTEHTGEAKYFDLQNGVFLPAKPTHEFHISGKTMHVLTDLLNTKHDEISELKIANQQRDSLLDALLDYYMLHMEGVTTFKSLPVLRELFHS